VCPKHARQSEGAPRQCLCISTTSWDAPTVRAEMSGQKNLEKLYRDWKRSQAPKRDTSQLWYLLALLGPFGIIFVGLFWLAVFMGFVVGRIDAALRYVWKKLHSHAGEH
jgi:hypothetical protein